MSNTQEIIQKLIGERLVENAKMQAVACRHDNISMLIAVATGEAPSFSAISAVMQELVNNPSLYN